MSRSPLPELDWDLTREFWAAAERAELVIPRCSGCGEHVWYPEEACPHCGSAEIPWERMSGRGKLFSWARVERALYPPFADKVPYVTGIVTLEENPRVRLVTMIVDCEPESLEVDMPMHVVFRPLEFQGVDGSVMAPHFAPAV